MEKVLNRHNVPITATQIREESRILKKIQVSTLLQVLQANCDLNGLYLNVLKQTIFVHCIPLSKD